MKKNNKGITLVALILTVIVLLILAGTIFEFTSAPRKSQAYNKMLADIEALNDQIYLYYDKYGELPISEPISVTNTTIPSGYEYYKINIKLLQNLTLNFGIEETTDDCYIINKTTHDIYYLKGIDINGQKKYTY